MPEQTPDDDTTDIQEELWYTQSNVASLNEDVARAIKRSTQLTDATIPQRALGQTHGELLDAYSSLTTTIDQLELTLANHFDDYRKTTPKEIKNEHAQRIKEQYDGPISFVAMELLQKNRREWLHDKTDTIGAEAVERHGLTENQRTWLNQLQDAWRDYDGE